LRMDRTAARSKQDRLIKRLARLDSLVVAFSAGVDSAFLLAAAQEALGKRVVAATAISPIHPRREQDHAVRFARERGIELVLLQTGELQMPEFVANQIDRCYHCKKALCQQLLFLARERKIAHAAHGANVNDLNDYRPGLAAAKEAGLMAPLLETDLSKEEIRFLAKEMGLSEWDKPAMACLATRFPYGSPITPNGLQMVEAAEEFLGDQGFSRVRVRHHGSVARIESGFGEIERMATEEMRMRIVKRLRAIGFKHVALDMEGYVYGKMNREMGESHDIGP